MPVLPTTVDVLNRVLVLVYRSLPRFVAEVRPWTHAGDEPVEDALAHVVADQAHYAARLVELIQDLGGAPTLGCYAIEFTDLHLLSLDYLLKVVVDQLRKDIAQLNRFAAQLGGQPAALALVEEILGNARGHLESLEGLLANIGKTTVA